MELHLGRAVAARLMRSPEAVGVFVVTPQQGQYKVIYRDICCVMPC
jgi:hypothetical protein